MVKWVCEASEVILKGLQWKSWSDDGQDGPSENFTNLGLCGHWTQVSVGTEKDIRDIRPSSALCLQAFKLLQEIIETDLLMLQ